MYNRCIISTYVLFKFVYSILGLIIKLVPNSFYITKMWKISSNTRCKALALYVELLYMYMRGQTGHTRKRRLNRSFSTSNDTRCEETRLSEGVVTGKKSHFIIIYISTLDKKQIIKKSYRRRKIKSRLWTLYYTFFLTQHILLLFFFKKMKRLSQIGST